MELTAPKKSVSVIKMNGLAIISLILGVLSITLTLGYPSLGYFVAYNMNPIFIFLLPLWIIARPLQGLFELVALIAIGLGITAVISGWFARKQIKQNSGSQFSYALTWIGIATGANTGFILIYGFCVYTIIPLVLRGLVE